MVCSGKLNVGDDFIHESIIGSIFKGKIEKTTTVEDKIAVVPRIEGSARITGYNSIILDQNDPYVLGVPSAIIHYAKENFSGRWRNCRTFLCLLFTQRRTRVTVLDKSDMNVGASYVNAGYLTPSHIVPLAAPGMVIKGLKWMFDSSSPFISTQGLMLTLWIGD